MCVCVGWIERAGPMMKERRSKLKKEHIFSTLEFYRPADLLFVHIFICTGAAECTYITGIDDAKEMFCAERLLRVKARESFSRTLPSSPSLHIVYYIFRQQYYLLYCDGGKHELHFSSVELKV